MPFAVLLSAILSKHVFSLCSIDVVQEAHRRIRHSIRTDLSLALLLLESTFNVYF